MTSVEFPCIAIGNPKPQITWLNQNNKVIDSEDGPRLTVLPQGSLRIDYLIWDDLGDYTCIAKNSNGQDTITTFVYPVMVSVDDSMTRRIASVGRSVTTVNDRLRVRFVVTARVSEWMYSRIVCCSRRSDFDCSKRIGWCSWNQPKL